MTELLESELNAFLITATEAADLGSAGQVLDGYRCLPAGQERAREAQEFGEPWAAELVARYTLALRRYGEEWGLRVE